MGSTPVAPGSVVIEPSRSVHLRAAFDDDPSAYAGRFVPDALKPEQIDENVAVQTRCSEFLTTKVVTTNQEIDETAFTSTKAAASLGVPLLIGASASHGVEGRMRIKYTLTKRIQTIVKDPAGLDRCCKGQPDQCSQRIIGEFLMGTGEIYQYAGREDDVAASGVVRPVSGDIEYKDRVGWKRVNSFKDTYFAFLTTQVALPARSQDASASDASCGWCDAIPQSLDGRYFCGISPDVSSEDMARDLAMRNARDQVVKYLGEYISSEGGSVANSVSGYLRDESTLHTASQGIATNVKDQKWCKAERSGALYKVRVLAFFPNSDTRAGAGAAVDAVVTARKRVGALLPDEAAQLTTARVLVASRKEPLPPTLPSASGAMVPVKALYFYSDVAAVGPLFPAAGPLMDALVQFAKDHPELDLQIAGHTDDNEPAKLSQQRALAVRGYLVRQGIAAERLYPTGYGATRPAQPGTTESARAKNRRVEFTAIDRSSSRP